MGRRMKYLYVVLSEVFVVVLTFEEGTEGPCFAWSQRGVLTYGQLHEVERETSDRQHQYVGDDEGTCRKSG